MNREILLETLETEATGPDLDFSKGVEEGIIGWPFPNSRILLKFVILLDLKKMYYFF